MRNKQSIQTNLLGQAVLVGEETGTATGPPTWASGKWGEIRNVYYDRHGDLMYTISVPPLGPGQAAKLIDVYSCSFEL